MGGSLPGDKPVFDGKVTGLMLMPTESDGKWTLRYTSPVSGKRAIWASVHGNVDRRTVFAAP